MLTHEVTIERMTGNGPRGATFGTPQTRAAHVEERVVLRVDERTDSATAGTIIEMHVVAILQLEDYCEPGTRVTWNGRTVVVGNSIRLEHRDAPSHNEIACV